MGNLRSVLNAFRHAGGDVRLVSTPADLRDAEALVFPGQGCIVDCVALLQRNALADSIRGWIREDRPFFGICLGLQALFSWSEEGATPGLDIFPGQVRRFRLPPPWKIPHMGWNAVRWRPSAPLVDNPPPFRDHYYFVHSYCAVPEDARLTWCEADYGGPFCAGLARGNCFATQFHPEKSQALGLALYRSFLAHTLLVAR